MADGNVIGGEGLGYRSRLLNLLRSPFFVPACFIAFVAIRLLVLLCLPVIPKSDAGWYVQRGIELASGEGYHEGALPTAYWPIGYPLFLAAVFKLFGHHIIAAQYANLGLSCGIFFLTYRLARRTFDNEDGARLAVLLLTIYPNQIAYTGILFSEMFATFLLLLGCDLFVRRATLLRTLAAALVFGLGALVKAQFLLFPAILLAIHGWRSWRSRIELGRLLLIGGIFALGMSAVVLPVTVRNYLVFHHFVLISTNGGRTFLTGNNPDARGDFTPGSSLEAAADFSVADQVAADARSYAVAMEWIKSHPGRFALLIPMKIWRLWAPDGEGEWWFQGGYMKYDNYVTIFRVLRVFNQIYYSALIVGTVGALALLATRQFELDRWVWLGALLFAYLTLISAVYSGQSRFHIPAMPFVMGYTGWFLSMKLNGRFPSRLGRELKSS